jgi:hypothetical protein
MVGLAIPDAVTIGHGGWVVGVLEQLVLLPDWEQLDGSAFVCAHDTLGRADSGIGYFVECLAAGVAGVVITGRSVGQSCGLETWGGLPIGGRGGSGAEAAIPTFRPVSIDAGLLTGVAGEHAVLFADGYVTDTDGVFGTTGIGVGDWFEGLTLPDTRSPVAIATGEGEQKRENSGSEPCFSYATCG